MCYGTNHWKKLNKFFDFMVSIDTSGKIKFTMSVTKESFLKFLDLTLNTKEHNKICVDVYPKSTNSFKYVLFSTCYLERNINNTPKSIALRLRRIWHLDENFDMSSHEYQNCLTARDYNISLARK